MAKQEIIDRRPPLTDNEKELMLAILIRKQDAFEAARSRLTYGGFDEHETYLSITWQVVCEHFDEHNQMPAEEHITTAVNARMEEDEMLFAIDGQTGQFDEFLAWAFRLKKAVLRESLAMTYLRRFLQEKLAWEVQEKFSTGYMPTSMFGLLQALGEQASEIEVLDTESLDEPFAEGWDAPEEVPEKITTGMGFLDEFMGGGAAVGETHGVLGPYMGGKTTMFVQLSAGMADNAYKNWIASDRQGVLKVVYHFTWEEPPFSLRLRALSMLGRINKDELERALENHDYTLLSTTHALKEYERRMFAKQLEHGEEVEGELERFRRALIALNHTWRIVDMTGNDPKHPGRGAGLVTEVASIVRQDQALRKRMGQTCGVGGVFADYVGAAAERHIDAHDIPRADLRHFINRWPYHMKHKVAVAFQCPAWSAHQLNAAANSLRPGTVPKHTDSAEGRAFGENLDFCFVLGTSTPENILLCACTKHRRRQKPERAAVLKLDGALCRMVDRSRAYVRKGSDIVRRDEAGQLTDGSGGGSDQPADIPSSDDEQVVTSQQRSIQGNTYSPRAVP